MLIYILLISIIILLFFINLKKKLKKEISIFCINLDTSYDRWKNIKKYSLKNNIIISRFSAFNGKLLNEKKLIKDNILHENHHLLKGQLGCAYSHICLMKMLINSKKDYYLILEDDVILPENLNEEITYILNNSPYNWDIIYLGGCNVSGKKYNKNFLIPDKYGNRYNLCTHAFILNKKNLYKIINILTPIRYSIDVQLRKNFKNLNVYYTIKNIIKQNKNILSERRILDGIKQSKFWKINHDKITIN